MSDDLRNWLSKADALGELLTIDGADWDMEIGTATALNLGKKGCPALLFDNIKGYPKGYRVLTCTGSSPSLVAMTLNLPITHSDLELLHILLERMPQWEANLDKFTPKVVTTGPVLENIIIGAEVDLFKIPAPKYNLQDGGRYIGTGHAVITKDPDTGDVNLGTYRMQLHNRNNVGWFMSPNKHGDYNRKKYHSKGQPCPVLVSVGHHPIIFRVSGMELATGVEYKYAGAMRGEPIQVINEEITGLPMPADSEIILAGWCRPNVSRQEGPYGEWTGYYKGVTQSLVVEIERIYHRNDPILVGAPDGLPPASDVLYYRSLFRSALLHHLLTQTGIPDVRGVWVCPEAGGPPFIIVSLKQRYAGHARQAALLVSQFRALAYQNRFVVVVDDDIDPTNISEVLWAMGSRTDPEKDIDILRRIPTSRLDPMIQDAENDELCNSRAIIDACRPYKWKDEFAIPVQLDPDIVKRVKSKWPSLAR